MPVNKLSEKKIVKSKKQKDQNMLEPNAFLDIKDGKRNKYYRAILSAALASIPWVGSVYSALITMQAESEQGKINDLQKMWLLEHREKIQSLGQTLQEITARLDNFCKNTEVEEIIINRIQSQEYLTLVRETFRSWDEASTKEKKDKFKKLITNAAAIKLCTDDMVRIFIKWIAQYHEYHLLMISEVYKSPGISPGAIWDNVFGEGNKEKPQENSAEADLYRTLMRDLQMGGVIRQHREVTHDGQFLKKSTKGKRSSNPSTVMKSSFDDNDKLELSELGTQFVHYVLEDVVPQISGTKTN